MRLKRPLCCAERVPRELTPFVGPLCLDIADCCVHDSAAKHLPENLVWGVLDHFSLLEKDSRVHHYLPQENTNGLINR